MKFKSIKLFLRSREKRTLLFLFAGASLNIAYASYELFLSFKYSEFWTGAVAIYYMLLSSIKILLLKNEKRLKKVQGFSRFKKEGKRIYSFCGILLFTLNIIMIIISVGIIFFGNKTRGQVQIIVAAIYAVWRVIVALKDIFYYKNAHNYVISAAKIISLSVALIALLSLEISMLKSLNVEALFIRVIGIISAAAMLTAQFSLSAYMISHNSY